MRGLGRRLRSLAVRIPAALIVCGAIVALASPVMAQGTAPATIFGQVTDESGAILPGVTVTAASPALIQGEVTTVTDERGEYRLSPLPIGMYQVAFELAGFQGVKLDGIRLTVGFAAKLDQTLKVGALEETVIVSGASPVVDVTSGGAVTEMTRENVDLIPLARDGVNSFLMLVPGTRTKYDVGGSGMTDTPVFKIYGQLGDQWNLLDGVLTADLAQTGSGSHYEFNAIEGIQFQTTGNNAEMPKRGMMIDTTIKSGGNEFHGNAVSTWNNQGLQSDNIDDELRRAGVQGATEVRERWDLSGTLGGKIVQDRTWFFGALRGGKDIQTILGAFHADGSEVLREQEQLFYVGKITQRLTEGHTVIGMYHRTWQKEIRGASAFIRPEAMIDHRSIWPPTWKVEWQGVPTNAVLISAQYGGWGRGSRDTGFSDDPSRVDRATQIRTGAGVAVGMNQDRRRKHARVTMTTYRSGRFGSHDVKTGADFIVNSERTRRDSRSMGNYDLIFDNGAAVEIDTFNYPSVPISDSLHQGVYGQDSWQLGRRLTLNVGARFDRIDGHVPEQCREAGQFAPATCFARVQMKIMKAFVPRAFAAFDVFGDGRTAIRGGYGRYAHIRNVDPEVLSLNLNRPETVRFRWRDLNGNRDYDPGEVNLDQNGPDFISFSTASRALPNQDEKMPMSDEVSLAFEHQLAPSVSVRVGTIYSRNFDQLRFANVRIPYDAYNIPITNRDPGPDGVLNNADDGNLVTYFDFPAQFAGGQFQQTMLINDSRSDTTFRTYEFAFAKRLSNRWQFTTSYVATKRNIPFGVGDTYREFNPNQEINTTDQTWEYTTKIAGSVVLPYDVLASAHWERISGDPLARQVLFRGGRQVPSLVVNVEPIGSVELPDQTLVDARFAKQFNVRGKQLEARVDVFNVLNSNTVRSINVRSGSSFLLPTTVFLPRIVQLGMSVTF